MSAADNGTLDIPDGIFKFNVGGTVVSLDVVEAEEEMGRIMAARKGEDGMVYGFDYLRDFQDWLKKKGFVQERGLGLLRGLWDKIDVVYLALKKAPETAAEKIPT